MLIVELGTGSAVKQMIEMINDVVGVCGANFIFSRKGMTLRGVDYLELAMIELRFSSDAFPAYQCHCQTTVSIAFELFQFLVVYANDDDIVILKAQDDQQQYPENIIFILQRPSSAEEQRMCTYSLNQRNIQMVKNGPHAPIPIEVILKMPSVHLSSIYTDLDSLDGTSSVTLEVSWLGRVRFVVTVDNGTTIMQCIHVVKGVNVIRFSRAIRVKFLLLNMKMVIKATPLSNTVTICLSDQIPCMFEYNYNLTPRTQLPMAMGLVRYYLMPDPYPFD